MSPHASPILLRPSAALVLSALLASAGIGLRWIPAADAASDSAAHAADAGARDAELDWARDALERNGRLEVVSSDPATGLITVRVKSTGELRQIRADRVIASLPPNPGSRQPAGAPPAPAGERVIASGPGYSIAATGPAPTAQGAQAASGGNAESGGPARDLPVEHRHDPIICQGARLLHIDSRNLVFDGDAVSAQQGCELHITNSSITAQGVGVSANDASVHIDNSYIAGSRGAVDAEGGAQVYARSSTFKGLIRRNDRAAFHDLGGNVGN